MNDKTVFTTKLLEQIKEFFIFFYAKPFHTILIGTMLILIYLHIYKSIKILLPGLLMLAFSIGTIIETNYTRNKYRKQIVEYYNELSGNEKEIIEYCLKNSRIAFRPDICSAKDYTESIYSLVGKGFGTNISSGNDFLISNVAYRILKSIKK